MCLVLGVELLRWVLLMPEVDSHQSIWVGNGFGSKVSAHVKSQCRNCLSPMLSKAFASAARISHSPLLSPIVDCLLFVAAMWYKDRVFFGSMMLSHSRCACQSPLTQTESLNVNRCVHMRSTQLPARTATARPSSPGLLFMYRTVDLFRLRPVSSHIAGRLCRSTAACRAAVDTLFAHSEAGSSSSSFSRRSQRNSVELLSAVMFFSSCRFPTFSWSIPKLYPALIFIRMRPRYFEGLQVT